MVRHAGRDLVGATFGDSKLKFDALMHVLLALAVVIVTARVVAGLFAYFKQPPMIGEVLGLELDLGLVRKRTHATVAVSHAIVVPFLAAGVVWAG